MYLQLCNTYYLFAVFLDSLSKIKHTKIKNLSLLLNIALKTCVRCLVWNVKSVNELYSF